MQVPKPQPYTKLRTISTLIGMTLSILFMSLFIFTAPLFAQYDNGAYGRCAYNEECDDNIQPGGGTNYRGSGSDNNNGAPRRREPGETTKVMEPIQTKGLNALNPVINWVNEMPDTKKQQLPFYGWLLLAILALILTIQALIDKHKTNQLLALIDKLRQTLDEQKNFIRLVSHHLNTPLATSKNSLELLESTQPPEPQAVSALKPAILGLSTTIDSATAEIADNSDGIILANISNQPKVTIKSTLTKWYFLLPISIAIIGGVFINFIVARIGIENKSVYFTFQIVTGIMVIIIFANIVRMIRTSRQRYKITQNINKSAGELTEKRSRIIQALGNSLQAITSNIKNGAQQIHNQKIKSLMTGGTVMLARLSAIMQVLFSPATPVSSASIQSIVTSVIANNHPQVESKNITITTDLQVAPNTSIHTSEFTFVLNSLVENAVDFCKENGNINIKATQNKDFIDISITDDGAGINPSDLGRLFQPFSSSNDVLSYDHNGLGLSLYAGKQLLERIGGKITINSKPNQGTTASFAIPAA